MKKISLIWSIGALLNILMICIAIYFLDYFSEKLMIPIVWVIINFVPISAVLAYQILNDINIKAKKIYYWLLLLFLGLCLLSIFSRSLVTDYESFVDTIKYTPFFLLPIQFIILLQLIKAGRMRRQFDISFKIENKEQAIDYIQKGNTLTALNLLLKKSKNNEKLYEYLSLQKSTLTTAKRQHLANTIKNEDYQRTVNRVSQSLLDLLIG